MTINELYERLFDLRAAQANCSVDERAMYEAEIVEVRNQIDKIERMK